MSVPSSAAGMAAYQMVSTHGGVAAADPHRLVLMLLDGALARLAQARGSAERGATAEKSVQLGRVLAILDELRHSLDLSQGSIATNLDSLYDYMSRQLLKAHVDNGVAVLDQVAYLLGEIRTAWTSLPAEVRGARRAGAPP
jgi:flagellar secretion chaperone FliS